MQPLDGIHPYALQLYTSGLNVMSFNGLIDDCSPPKGYILVQHSSGTSVLNIIHFIFYGNMGCCYLILRYLLYTFFIYISYLLILLFVFSIHMLINNSANKRYYYCSSRFTYLVQRQILVCCRKS